MSSFRKQSSFIKRRLATIDKMILTPRTLIRGVVKEVPQAKASHYLASKDETVGFKRRRKRVIEETPRTLIRNVLNYGDLPFEMRPKKTQNAHTEETSPLMSKSDLENVNLPQLIDVDKNVMAQSAIEKSLSTLEVPIDVGLINYAKTRRTFHNEAHDDKNDKAITEFVECSPDLRHHTSKSPKVLVDDTVSPIIAAPTDKSHNSPGDSTKFRKNTEDNHDIIEYEGNSVRMDGYSSDREEFPSDTSCFRTSTAKLPIDEVSHTDITNTIFLRDVDKTNVLLEQDRVITDYSISDADRSSVSTDEHSFSRRLLRRRCNSYNDASIVATTPSEHSGRWNKYTTKQDDTSLSEYLARPFRQRSIALDTSIQHDVTRGMSSFGLTTEEETGPPLNKSSVLSNSLRSVSGSDLWDVSTQSSHHSPSLFASATKSSEFTQLHSTYTDDCSIENEESLDWGSDDTTRMFGLSDNNSLGLSEYNIDRSNDCRTKNVKSLPSKKPTKHESTVKQQSKVAIMRKRRAKNLHGKNNKSLLPYIRIKELFSATATSLGKRVTLSAIDALSQVSVLFLSQIMNNLQRHVIRQGRYTIECSDVEILLENFLSNEGHKETISDIAHKYLPREFYEDIVPTATVTTTTATATPQQAIP